MSEAKEKVIQPGGEDQVEGSKRFPPVVVISPLFGVAKGVELRFDFNTGKYISITETEDIGPAERYFYSGSAIALDPYLVRKSIGELFEYSKVDKELVTEDDLGLVKPDVDKVPEVWDVADLVVKCNQCGSITKIDTITKGVQFLMSTTSDSTVELRCPMCESGMSLVYENGRAFTEEELVEFNKESKLEIIEEPIKDTENESQEESTK